MVSRGLACKCLRRKGHGTLPSPVKGFISFETFILFLHPLRSLLNIAKQEIDLHATTAERESSRERWFESFCFCFYFYLFFSCLKLTYGL